MALHALGVGNEDEVILADTNWIATVSPISHLGATPVFVDILQDTWCIDPLKAEAAITEKPKLLLQHIFTETCVIWMHLWILASDIIYQLLRTLLRR